MRQQLIESSLIDLFWNRSNKEDSVSGCVSGGSSLTQARTRLQPNLHHQGGQRDPLDINMTTSSRCTDVNGRMT